MKEIFGTVFSTDSCKVVGKTSDTKLQVIYPIFSGYKLGWVSVPKLIPSDFPLLLRGYNASSDARTTVYESLSTMGTYYGQIFVDDLCTLNAVNVREGWAYVTYPVGTGTKTGYVYLNDFVPTNTKLTTFYTTTVTQQTTTYRKADMAVQFGWVSVGDEITVIGKSENKLQILYPIDEQYGGGYKIAWMYDTYVVKNLKEITVTSNPSKTSYLEGESLDKSGLVITAKYDNGSSSDITEKCSFSGYDNTPGVKTVKATYKGKETAFTVNVKSQTPTEMRIKTMPNKTEYKVGEKIDLTGLEVQVSYDNNTTEIVSDIIALFEDEITDTEGTKPIEINYEYHGEIIATSFNIKVIDTDVPVEPTTFSEPIDPDSPKFKISNVNAKEGTTIKVDISIENNPGITSFNFKVEYPKDILTLKSVEYKDLFSTKASGSNEMNSPLTISWFSTKSEDENENGVIATLSFEVKKNIKQDKYPITLKYNEEDVFNISFNNVIFSVENGSLTVVKSIPGDVNGDTSINMKDIVLLQQYLNEWEVEIDEIAANVNGDSGINMKDIVLLQQYLNDWDVELK